MCTPLKINEAFAKRNGGEETQGIYLLVTPDLRCTKRIVKIFSSRIGKAMIMQSNLNAQNDEY